MPTFSQASIDLQICTPRSLTRVTLVTLLPHALSNLETESPRRLFLIWPRCNGLLVLGEENSTIMFFPVDGRIPNPASPAISVKSSFQYSGENNMLRYPFTLLYPATSETLAFNHSPIAFPVFSGEAWVIRKRGKTTNV